MISWHCSRLVFATCPTFRRAMSGFIATLIHAEPWYESIET